MKKLRAKNYLKNISCRAVLVAGDSMALFFSFAFAYYLRVWLNKSGFFAIETPEISYFFPYWYLLLFYIFFLYFYKVYNHRQTFWQDLKKIIKAVGISAVFIFFILALLKISQDVSRFIIIAMSVIALVLIPSLKALIKYLLFKCGMWHAHCLIIADADERFEAFLENIKKNWYVGYMPAYVARLNSEDCAEMPGVLTREKLEQIIKENNIVVPILYRVDKNLFYDLFVRLDIFFHNIKLIPDMHSLFVNNISIEGDGDNIYINFNNNLLKLNNRIIQHLFNKTASFTIAVLISPLLLIIAALIRMDSKGPALYRAKRIGRREKDFFIYKFRTMHNDADKKLDELLSSSEELRKEFTENFKLKDDPRITRVGRFLRKTSLDELPQIFNVLKGEMNLIGPRPIVRDEAEKYGSAFYELIKVKPGMSGLWQISGRNDVDYEKRVQLDLFYIKNWSLWMDIMILFRTFLVVLQGRGAY